VSTSSGAGPADGRLRFRPTSPAAPSGRTGLLTLPGTHEASPAHAYVPATAHDGSPLRLVLFLHGAGGAAGQAVDALRSFADQERLVLVGPKSARATWDVISGGYGPDVENIDHLLETISAAYPISGYTVAGFSDGASYALSMGIVNGDVFDSVIAFSPGFHAARASNGSPRFFVSHGTQDEVLPINRCSRRLVPELERRGYAVTYQEFVGGHAVPQMIKQAAIDWLTG
jgi:predicted esterase